MKLVDVSSSNLQAVGWQAGTLRILFHSGVTYDYFNVPARVHGALMAAESKNEFFRTHVMDKFKYAKVNLEKERNNVSTEEASSSR